MTASEVDDLAFEYLSLKLQDLPYRDFSDKFKDAQSFFESHGGKESDYEVFIALVFTYIKCQLELIISDCYMATNWVHRETKDEN